MLTISIAANVANVDGNSKWEDLPTTETNVTGRCST